ncbi:MAG TPA: class I SAM-dependent methyltransferase [Candidatus Polarisedimenticolaceae bacterium]|nr:class I SAM-dependent methyltransferase [Candidatus Polarisedimenticolaceae bacterium]
MTDLETNRAFYDRLWAGSRLVEPDRFNTWPLVRELVEQSRQRLEVAPGLRPRLPIEGTHFVDISEPALARLRGRAAGVALRSITDLPFDDGQFDLVCAFDIVEHVDDEHRAFSELARVCAPGGALLLSVPLHAAHWSAFDDAVGHRRRYEAVSLLDQLGTHGFAVERSAPFGMQPKSSWLLQFGMWALTHRRERALWWYNRVLMPLGIRLQKQLTFEPGLIDTTGVETVLLVCRRQSSR